MAEKSSPTLGSVKYSAILRWGTLSVHAQGLNSRGGYKTFLRVHHASVPVRLDLVNIAPPGSSIEVLTPFDASVVLFVGENVKAGDTVTIHRVDGDDTVTVEPGEVLIPEPPVGDDLRQAAG